MGIGELILWAVAIFGIYEFVKSARKAYKNQSKESRTETTKRPEPGPKIRRPNEEMVLTEVWTDDEWVEEGEL